MNLQEQMFLTSMMERVGFQSMLKLAKKSDNQNLIAYRKRKIYMIHIFGLASFASIPAQISNNLPAPTPPAHRKYANLIASLIKKHGHNYGLSARKWGYQEQVSVEIDSQVEVELKRWERGKCL